MYRLSIPEGYKSALDVRQTQIAIKKIKDYFERDIAVQLELMRVSAPLFVDKASWLNDTLNGVQRPVAFDIKDYTGKEFEIVQSLAKWKRYALKKYGVRPGEGIYTDMNAIRRDEDVDNIHSVFVDQWDWEKRIEKCDRTEETLKNNVRLIYSSLRHTERYVARDYDFFERFLPEDIFFITTQELEDMYPELTPKERENRIAREKKAVFIMKIGGTLKSGEIHDGRAPDYDDWELNGDILVWFAPLNCAVELSSMGIRVDAAALRSQLAESGHNERAGLPFHKMLLEGKLPQTIGGGIGQSRLCLVLLKKAHIGEVQVSYWPPKMIEDCRKCGIEIL